jgi:hypothetical protein
MVCAWEHSTLNRLVVGSIPTASTTFSLFLGSTSSVCGSRDYRPMNLRRNAFEIPKMPLATNAKVDGSGTGTTV